MNVTRRSLPAVVAAVLYGAASPAHAQFGERDITARDQALEQIERIDAVTRAAREGIDYSDVPGGPVSFAEVLRAPDDPDLNMRYARTQIAEGNLRGAAATLERVLASVPDATQVRLLYAFVLYRLDSAEAARAQIERVREGQPDERTLARTDRLESLIARRERRTRVGMTVGGGVSYRTNANYAPDSKRIDAIVNFFGTPLQLRNIPVAGAEDDVAWLGQVGLDVSHDLGNQAGDEVYGGVDAFFNEQVTVDTNDYRSFDGRVGLRKQLSFADLDVQLGGSHFRLDGEAFVNTVGVQLSLERRFMDGRLTLRGRHRTAYESFDVADDFTAQRTGARFDFDVNARYVLAPAHRIDAGVGYTSKRARRDFREYDAARFSLAHVWLLARGMYLVNRLRYGVDLYDEPNPFVSSTRRRDDDLGYQLIFAGTLAGLAPAGMLTRGLRDVAFSVTGTLTRADSNIQNFEYDDAGVEVFLSKRFDLF